MSRNHRWSRLLGTVLGLLLMLGIYLIVVGLATS